MKLVLVTSSWLPSGIDKYEVRGVCEQTTEEPSTSAPSVPWPIVKGKKQGRSKAILNPQLIVAGHSDGRVQHLALPIVCDFANGIRLLKPSPLKKGTYRDKLSSAGGLKLPDLPELKGAFDESKLKNLPYQQHSDWHLSPSGHVFYACAYWVENRDRIFLATCIVPASKLASLTRKPKNQRSIKKLLKSCLPALGSESQEFSWNFKILSVSEDFQSVNAVLPEGQETDGKEVSSIDKETSSSVTVARVILKWHPAGNQIVAGICGSCNGTCIAAFTPDLTPAWYRGWPGLPAGGKFGVGSMPDSLSESYLHGLAEICWVPGSRPFLALLGVCGRIMILDDAGQMRRLEVTDQNGKLLSLADPYTLSFQSVAGIDHTTDPEPILIRPSCFCIPTLPRPSTHKSKTYETAPFSMCCTTPLTPNSLPLLFISDGKEVVVFGATLVTRQSYDISNIAQYSVPGGLSSVMSTPFAREMSLPSTPASNSMIPAHTAHMGSFRSVISSTVSTVIRLTLPPLNIHKPNAYLRGHEVVKSGSPSRSPWPILWTDLSPRSTEPYRSPVPQTSPTHTYVYSTPNRTPPSTMPSTPAQPYPIVAPQSPLLDDAMASNCILADEVVLSWLNRGNVELMKGQSAGALTSYGRAHIFGMLPTMLLLVHIHRPTEAFALLREFALFVSALTTHESAAAEQAAQAPIADWTGRADSILAPVFASLPHDPTSETPLVSPSPKPIRPVSAFALTPMLRSPTSLYSPPLPVLEEHPSIAEEDGTDAACALKGWAAAAAAGKGGNQRDASALTNSLSRADSQGRSSAVSSISLQARISDAPLSPVEDAQEVTAHAADHSEQLNVPSSSSLTSILTPPPAPLEASSSGNEHAFSSYVSSPTLHRRTSLHDSSYSHGQSFSSHSQGPSFGASRFALEHQLSCSRHQEPIWMPSYVGVCNQVLAEACRCFAYLLNLLEEVGTGSIDGGMPKENERVGYPYPVVWEPAGTARVTKSDTGTPVASCSVRLFIRHAALDLVKVEKAWREAQLPLRVLLPLSAGFLLLGHSALPNGQSKAEMDRQDSDGLQDRPSAQSLSGLQDRPTSRSMSGLRERLSMRKLKRHGSTARRSLLFAQNGQVLTKPIEAGVHWQIARLYMPPTQPVALWLSRGKWMHAAILALNCSCVFRKVAAAAERAQDWLTNESALTAVDGCLSLGNAILSDRVSATCQYGVAVACEELITICTIPYTMLGAWSSVYVGVLGEAVQLLTGLLPRRLCVASLLPQPHHALLLKFSCECIRGQLLEQLGRALSYAHRQMRAAGRVLLHKQPDEEQLRSLLQAPDVNGVLHLLMSWRDSRKVTELPAAIDGIVSYAAVHAQGRLSTIESLCAFMKEAAGAVGKQGEAGAPQLLSVLDWHRALDPMKERLSAGGIAGVQLLSVEELALLVDMRHLMRTVMEVLRPHLSTLLPLPTSLLPKPYTAHSAGTLHAEAPNGDDTPGSSFTLGSVGTPDPGRAVHALGTRALLSLMRVDWVMYCRTQLGHHTAALKRLLGLGPDAQDPHHVSSSRHSHAPKLRQAEALMVRWLLAFVDIDTFHRVAELQGCLAATLILVDAATPSVLAELDSLLRRRNIMNGRIAAEMTRLRNASQVLSGTVLARVSGGSGDRRISKIDSVSPTLTAAAAWARALVTPEEVLLAAEEANHAYRSAVEEYERSVRAGIEAYAEREYTKLRADDSIGSRSQSPTRSASIVSSGSVQKSYVPASATLLQPGTTHQSHYTRHPTLLRCVLGDEAPLNSFSSHDVGAILKETVNHPLGESSPGTAEAFALELQALLTPGQWGHISTTLKDSDMEGLPPSVFAQVQEESELRVTLSGHAGFGLSIPEFAKRSSGKMEASSKHGSELVSPTGSFISSKACSISEEPVRKSLTLPDPTHPPFISHPSDDLLSVQGSTPSNHTSGGLSETLSFGAGAVQGINNILNQDDGRTSPVDRPQLCLSPSFTFRCSDSTSSESGVDGRKTRLGVAESEGEIPTEASSVSWDETRLATYKTAISGNNPLFAPGPSPRRKGSCVL